MSYQNASITGRSQLTTVTECDGRASAGAADGACKTPLTFTWSQGSPDFTPIDLTDVTDAGTSPNGHGGNRILPVDIDGDGRDDLLYTDADNNWKLRRSTGTGFGPPTDAGIARAGTDTESLIKLVDFDLDGRTDAMAEVPDSSRGGTGWQLFRSDGTKFVPYVDNIGFFGNDDDLPDQVHFLDLDGNGTPDFLTAADEINPDASTGRGGTGSTPAPRTATGSSRRCRWRGPASSSPRAPRSSPWWTPTATAGKS